VTLTVSNSEGRHFSSWRVQPCEPPNAIGQRRTVCGKEIEGLRGGVPGYAAQANPKIDAAKAEKDPFRMETSLGNR